MWRRSFLFCCIFAAALAAVSIAPLEPKPDKYKDVPGCYISELDMVLPVGSTAPSRTSCMQYRCHTENVLYESCGAVGAGPGCVEVPGNQALPYPQCCPTLQCE